ncbi:MAG: protoheme IX farnesyltransferase [Geobacteraceae bacterium]|nr:protoheme IX farnesyltransferase [Geobacteraceae bacterium]
MITALARLFRLRLALLNGVAALGGAMLFPLPVDSRLLWMVFIGVTLLAAGGSAINQALEHELDRVMIRTRLRPVAQGRMKPVQAALLGLAIVLAGVALLGVAGGSRPALAGALGIFWYLAVYTPLKRRTPYALAAGAVCGALPPVIGWGCAGGSLPDYRIMLLAGLLYLWQIPHFWLFQRRYAADYRAAGFPLLAAATREGALPGLFGLWIAALVSATMLLPAFGLIAHGTAIWYALVPLPLIAMTLLRSEKPLFSYLNLFPLLVTLAIIAHKQLA